MEHPKDLSTLWIGDGLLPANSQHTAELTQPLHT